MIEGARLSNNPPPPGVPQPPPPRVPQPPPPPGASRGPSGQRSVHSVPEGSKSYVVTLLLSVFLGLWGADRFYLGRTRSALFKLFTFGGFGYWWLIDASSPSSAASGTSGACV